MIGLELKRPQQWLEPSWGMSQDWTLTMDNSKTCTKCGQTLPLDAFSPKPNGRPGLRSECKPCRAAYTRQWTKNNPEKKQAWQKNRSAESIERKKASDKKWRIANKQRVRKNQILWEKKNPNKTRAIKQRWAIKNYAARRAILLRYRARKAETQIFVIKKAEMEKIYNSSCFFCSSTNQIEADHIIPLARNGNHSVGNLMAVCRSCNASKSSKTIMEFRIWKQRNGL